MIDKIGDKMKKFSKTANVACRIIEGQAFIVNTQTSTLHELDETGTFIWKLIEKGKNIDEVAEALSESFDVTRQNAGKDAEEFISELKKKGILQ